MKKRKTRFDWAVRPHYRGKPMRSMFVQVKRTVFRLEFGREIDRSSAIAIWDSITRGGTFDKAAAVCNEFERYLQTTIKIEMA